jgi:hypothetical protein
VSLDGANRYETPCGKCGQFIAPYAAERRAVVEGRYGKVVRWVHEFGCPPPREQLAERLKKATAELEAARWEMDEAPEEALIDAVARFEAAENEYHDVLALMGRRAA